MLKSTFLLLLLIAFHSLSTCFKVSLEGVQEIFPLKFLDAKEIEILLNKNHEDELRNFHEEPAVRFQLKDDQVSPRVEIEGLGTARGKVIQSFKGRDVFAFHSIPYAKPPEGELRFRMPEPWEGEWPRDIEEDYDASYLRARCPQASMAVRGAAGKEDCLHISIYTPPDILDKETSYPVMFFIHGGGFISGDASLYIPTKLMDQDVVVVVVQYRLGSFGFLSAQTDENPGNMGLMDQVMALRWIQSYISYFGGDPHSVTVFGQSAGGASTSWMTFTNQTTADFNGGSALLHGAIMESGSALEAWAHDPDPEEGFYRQANAVGCWDDTGDKPTILQCMRDATVEELVNGYLKVYYDDRLEAGLGFIGNSPIIQREFIENFPNETDSVVIWDHPLRLIENGEFLDVPLMGGSVRDEGSLVMGLVYDDFLIPNNLTDAELYLQNEVVNQLVDSFGIVDTTGSVANGFRLNFLRDATMGNFDSMVPGMVDMLGMLFLKSGAWSLSELLAYKDPSKDIFFYSFEYESDDSLFEWYFGTDMPFEGGVTHTDDLMYLFYLPSFMDGEQLEIVERMTTLWANFATYKNPTPSDEDNWKEFTEEWKPFTAESLNFLLMKSDFTLENDFPLRWNYNSPPSCPKIPVCRSGSTDQSDSQASFNRLLPGTNDGEKKAIEREEETKGWIIAVSALGLCCFMLLGYIVFLLLRIRT